MSKAVKCTLYAVVGAMVVPGVFVSFIAPFIILQHIGYDPAWGMLFWMLAAGAIGGVSLCIERAETAKWIADAASPATPANTESSK